MLVGFYHLISVYNAYVSIFFVDTANSEDPTEISFAKGEILDIVDKQGKWWQSRRADGSTGSAFFLIPSIILFISLTLP